MIGEKRRSTQDYRKIEQLSSSDLRLFALDRREFYKRVILKEQQTEEYSKSMLIGDIVHTLLLQPEEFDSKFMLSICSEPPTGLMLKFVEALYRHTVANTDESGNVLKDFEFLAREAYGDSGFKISIESVITKFKGSNAEDYYNELRQARSTSRHVVCVEDMGIAEKIVETLKNNEFTSSITNQQSDDRFEVHNELQIDDNLLDDTPIKLMIDKCIVDKELQTIDIFDYKIVWAPEKFYYEYYLKRRGDIQGFVYYDGIRKWSEKLYPNFKVRTPIFVVADSQNFLAPIKYRMTSIDVQTAYEGFMISSRYYVGVREIIECIKFGQEHGRWDIEKRIYENNGFSSLC